MIFSCLKTIIFVFPGSYKHRTNNEIMKYSKLSLLSFSSKDQGLKEKQISTIIIHSLKIAVASDECLHLKGTYQKKIL